MSEFLDLTGKVLGVLGTLGSTILTGIKLYERCFKPRPGDPDEPAPRGAQRTREWDQSPTKGRAWFAWGLAVAVAALLLGIVMLAVGSRLRKIAVHEIIERPDAQKVQQARERLQFRDSTPIPAKDFHRGMWDLMYSGVIEREYGGKVILVAGPVSSVSDSLHTVDLEAGAFPATVACSFGVRDHDRIKALRKGQTVTVRGEIRTYRNGSGGEVAQLADCELVSVEGGEKADAKRPR